MSEARTDHTHNYLLVSDVHLGAELVPHARPEAERWLNESPKVDRVLCGMLAHYREHRRGERPWRLVIAGDFIDFIGMAIQPNEESGFPLQRNEEERHHGLGSRPGHTVYKLKAVAERHHAVFEALAQFILQGHSVVLVPGNHDVDFHWKVVRAAFVEEVVKHLPRRAQRAAARLSIEFSPWFFYVENLLYVEHGHLFDPVCAHAHPLLPVSPSDPQRIGWSAADVLLRYVSRPTRGVGTEGHEAFSMLGYIRLALDMGIAGCLRLAWRFGRASVRLVSDSFDHMGEGAIHLKRRGRRRLRRFARKRKMDLARLEALMGLHAEPSHTRVASVMQTLMLDRVGLTLGVIMTCAVLPTLRLPWLVLLGCWSLVIAIGKLLSLWTARGRIIDPRPALRRAATGIARLLPTRYVVMGHTHHPAVRRITPHTLYVNLGHWGREDLPDDRGPDDSASLTFLVLQKDSDASDYVHQLNRWDAEAGRLSVHPGELEQTPSIAPIAVPSAR